MKLRIFVFSLLAAVFSTTLFGQIDPEVPSSAGVRLGEPRVSRFVVGARLRATRGPCRDVLVMVAVPFECDEQSAQIVEEDISPNVAKVDYRMLNGGARQRPRRKGRKIRRCP